MRLEQAPGVAPTDASEGDHNDLPPITPMQEAMRLHALTHPGMELQQIVLESDARFEWDRLVSA